MLTGENWNNDQLWIVYREIYTDVKRERIGALSTGHDAIGVRGKYVEVTRQADLHEIQSTWS